SEPASSDGRADLRDRAARARRNRRAARERAGEPRRGDPALGTRRGALPLLSLQARRGARADRGARAHDRRGAGRRALSELSRQALAELLEVGGRAGGIAAQLVRLGALDRLDDATAEDGAAHTKGAAPA